MLINYIVRSEDISLVGISCVNKLYVELTEYHNYETHQFMLWLPVIGKKEINFIHLLIHWLPVIGNKETLPSRLFI